MLFINRLFRMHCSVNFRDQMEKIFGDHNISVMSIKFRMNKIGGHEVETIFYECRASEEDLDRMIEHIQNNVNFTVSITY